MAKSRLSGVEWSGRRDEADGEFVRRFPGRSLADDLAPAHDRGPGTFSRRTDICSPAWPIACSQTLQGVEPVSPVVDRGLRGVGFARVDGRAPTLRWKPAGDRTVHYDVVIWEAVQYAVSNWKTFHGPGRVVAYGEDLEQPEFAVHPPLSPAAKYYWSVRLRRGGDVSSWSRAGHALNLLLYASWSSGSWFAFETP